MMQKISREIAMGARPAQIPIARREETPGGNLRITIRQTRPSWQRWLGGSPEFERTYLLDGYG